MLEASSLQSDMEGSCRRRTGVWASERQPSGSLRCGSSQRRNGSQACTAEDFTDVQFKTVDRLDLAALS